MLSTLSITSLISGVCLAYWAERYPRYTGSLELAGGLLIIVGLVLLGFGVEAILSGAYVH
jgi:hypothetical protein